MKKQHAVILSAFLVSSQAFAQIDAATLQAATHQAQKTYEVVTGNDPADVDWTYYTEVPGINDPASPGHKLRVLQWEGFNAGFHTYDRVRVLINDYGSTAGAEVLYMGR